MRRSEYSLEKDEGGIASAGAQMYVVSLMY
jgi:hypothetical protein